VILLWGPRLAIVISLGGVFGSAPKEPDSLEKVDDTKARAKAESQIARLERRLFDREMQTIIFADEDYQRLGGVPPKKRTPEEGAKYAELRTFFRQAWAQEMRTEYHGLLREIGAWKSWLTGEEPKPVDAYMELEGD
jgi:hypothetical protein